ncbi:MULTISPECIES: phosphate/phosphite/phosphonate ABC transporter substrate-binding protein [Haloferax]|uniref:Phosphate/phosphite/phosphonate ABC transporter substrate-binding protein n=1 Tax=Haloferax marinum TaxID=2666143 RepID=A0A6A8G5N4_9EURY|nr:MULTISPECIES: phosphate/phosphite/phosphonate ABC transporter substrate-binding protein [Haloferax]KAB1197317.1 phosphate/phosphite/phosphonate ABC transporter substrate-binding protein [Haloferax sp. CBA1150]MRW96359.1 phosphate/phosphite/phosphonate ABC transporter substrate-binding protein [Haloferax marinum]
MSSRRNFLKKTGAVGALGMAGLSGCIGSIGGGSDSVSFLLTPSESDVDIKQQYQPLFAYLEEEAGVTVESEVAADYAAVYQAFKSGQADLADSSPTIAIQGGNEGVTEVMGIRVAYGAAKYFSLMTTTPDSGVEELADLEGKTVAFADRLSTSGSLFPLYMLQQAGLDTGNAPDGDPVDFTGQWSDHSTARETLVNRDEVVAAGTGAFSVAAHVPKDQFPQQFLDVSAENDGDLGTESPQLDLLAASDPIPRAPIIVRSELEDGMKSSLTDALTSVTQDDLINEDLGEDEQLWFTGVEPGTVEDYEPIKNVIDSLGITLGQ